MPRRKLTLRCPTCKKVVLRTEREFPFCSERCRLIDLGKWASGGYVISTPISDPDDLDAIQYSQEKPRRPNGKPEDEPQ
ncbi:MAG: DNA gyrase inhibitor YacG [Terriglobales bacterium]